MRCPVCSERAKKVEKNKQDDLVVRCATDGDFVITEGAVKKMEGLSESLRQQALSRAILEAKKGERPRIRKSLVLSKREARAGSGRRPEAAAG